MYPSVGVGAGAKRRFGLGDPSLVTAQQIQTLIAQTSAAMDSANTAVKGCSAMQPTDITQWNGIYSGWQTWLDGLQTCIGDSFPSVHTACVNDYGYTLSNEWAAANAKLLDYTSQAGTWQQRVHNACPNYNPPVPPPAPNVQPQDQASALADAAKVGAVALLIAAGAYGVYRLSRTLPERSGGHQPKQLAMANPLRMETGYAYKKVGRSRDWDTVVISSDVADHAVMIGYREIDGSRMAVFRHGRTLYAQMPQNLRRV